MIHQSELSNRMTVKVYIPTPLRPFTGKQDIVEVEGRTVEEVLRNLTSQFSQLQQHLYSEDGNFRSYVNIYVNNDDIRYLAKGKTPVKQSDSISIIPSIAGGVYEGATAVDQDISLSNEEILRYSRHLIMPEVGMQGQRKLKASRVLLIGAGGLGSPLALYLSAAGVGKMGIVDFDVVDLTNLQRQVIHSTEKVGKPKLESARDAIRGINPHVVVETYETRLSSENALDILAEYDIIVDGTDNFPTRYLVNDACVLLGKPNVYGSIFRFDGQVTVFDARKGPCYRCLYPTPPPPDLVPSCAEGGVLGVLPGIIGTLQALETIKLIIGQGESLIGRLVLFDALRFSFREFTLKKNPDCPVCGQSPAIRELIDYDQFCGIEPIPADQSTGRKSEITVEQLKAKLDRGDNLFNLDVREPHEYEIVNIGGCLIPLGELPERVHELDSSKEIVVHCKSGARSAKAVNFLKRIGFTKVSNLAGGIDAWARKIDTHLPRY
jgi:molybdopterin/thiamine biosynthesis adenylyltransferase/rhodanese-related sulfurtransferase/molybdopterin converting factor small subunit